MPADRALAAWLAQIRSAPASLREVGATELRAAGRERARDRPPGPKLESVQDDRLAGGLALRRYLPAGAKATIVFVHGGGWVLGDLETHDRLCRLLAAGTGACVTAVDYRRAPEHQWPHAIEDVIAVVRSEHARKGSPHPLLVAGDSAGGTIALLACLGLRGSETLPRALSLACPNADLTLSHPSVARFGRVGGSTRMLCAGSSSSGCPTRACACAGISRRCAPRTCGTFRALTSPPPSSIRSVTRDARWRDD